MPPSMVNSCGCATQRRTVTDFVLNPCRRSAIPLPPTSGERLVAPDGAGVRFFAQLDGDRVADIQYEASSCATLVAYAELLGDLVAGEPLRQAAALPRRTLIEALPGVPAARLERADLVIHAWWSAVAKAVQARAEEQEQSGG